MPFLVIVILNIITFGCYAFCILIMLFWFIFIIIFNKLKIIMKMTKKKILQEISEVLHLSMIFILFLNYFGNQQKEF